MLQVRGYADADYSAIRSLYLQSETFGGVFSEHRDSRSRLAKRVAVDADSILIAEEASEVVGTISLIEDSRVAWLYRFAVDANHPSSYQAAKGLADRALFILKHRGHDQVLVYAPAEDPALAERYIQLGFKQGSDYTCYFRAIT